MYTNSTVITANKHNSNFLKLFFGLFIWIRIQTRSHIASDWFDTSLKFLLVNYTPYPSAFACHLFVENHESSVLPNFLHSGFSWLSSYGAIKYVAPCQPPILPMNWQVNRKLIKLGSWVLAMYWIGDAGYAFIKTGGT